jgi:hypothetical protein
MDSTALVPANGGNVSGSNPVPVDASNNTQEKGNHWKGGKGKGGKGGNKGGKGKGGQGKGGGKGGQGNYNPWLVYPGNSSSSSSSSHYGIPMEQKVCNLCNGPGHIAKNCTATSLVFNVPPQPKEKSVKVVNPKPVKYTPPYADFETSATAYWHSLVPLRQLIVKLLEDVANDDDPDDDSIGIDSDVYHGRVIITTGTKVLEYKDQIETLAAEKPVLLVCANSTPVLNVQHAHTITQVNQGRNVAGLAKHLQATTTAAFSVLARDGVVIYYCTHGMTRSYMAAHYAITMLQCEDGYNFDPEGVELELAEHRPGMSFAGGWGDLLRLHFRNTLAVGISYETEDAGLKYLPMPFHVPKPLQGNALVLSDATRQRTVDLSPESVIYATGQRMAMELLAELAGDYTRTLGASAADVLGGGPLADVRRTMLCLGGPLFNSTAAAVVQMGTTKVDMPLQLLSYTALPAERTDLKKVPTSLHERLTGRMVVGVFPYHAVPAANIASGLNICAVYDHVMWVWPAPGEFNRWRINGILTGLRVGHYIMTLDQSVSVSPLTFQSCSNDALSPKREMAIQRCWSGYSIAVDSNGVTRTVALDYSFTEGCRVVCRLGGVVIYQVVDMAEVQPVIAGKIEIPASIANSFVTCSKRAVEPHAMISLVVGQLPDGIEHPLPAVSVNWAMNELNRRKTMEQVTTYYETQADISVQETQAMEIARFSAEYQRDGGVGAGIRFAWAKWTGNAKYLAAQSLRSLCWWKQTCWSLTKCIVKCVVTYYALKACVNCIRFALAYTMMGEKPAVVAAPQSASVRSMIRDAATNSWCALNREAIIARITPVEQALVVTQVEDLPSPGFHQGSYEAWRVWLRFLNFLDNMHITFRPIVVWLSGLSERQFILHVTLMQVAEAIHPNSLLAAAGGTREFCACVVFGVISFIQSAKMVIMASPLDVVGRLVRLAKWVAESKVLSVGSASVTRVWDTVSVALRA